MVNYVENYPKHLNEAQEVYKQWCEQPTVSMLRSLKQTYGNWLDLNTAAIVEGIRHKKIKIPD